MDNNETLNRISELVAEEDRLRQQGADVGIDDTARARIAHIEVTLDQCWDLLRQRRARMEFGEDPDEAGVRDANTVKSYVQ
jgi:hypothetical protein